jgi:hypothetical protein
VSPFARGRHLAGPSTGLSYYGGSELSLVELINNSIDDEDPKPGYRDGVVLVRVPAEGFFSGLVQLEPGDDLVAEFKSRRPGEDAFVNVRALKDPQPAGHVEVVLYSHAVLAEDNEASDDDPESWEVISVNAQPKAGDVPMDPMTMARNFLGLAGGTKAAFTPEQFAQSILFWSRHVMCQGR